jgi:hypothetical protein
MVSAKRTGLVAASVLAAVAVFGCGTPAPTPSAAPLASAVPSPATAATPDASLDATGPKVVCHPNTTMWAPTDANGSAYPVAVFITLTCENAVAAALAVVGSQPDVAFIEFAYGLWCPPGASCRGSRPNEGNVIVHQAGQQPDIVVKVTADETGKVTAALSLATTR